MAGYLCSGHPNAIHELCGPIHLFTESAHVAAPYSRQRSGRVRQRERLVTLPPIWVRREERSIGLEHDEIFRSSDRGRNQIPGIAKTDRSGERHHIAGSGAAPGHRRVTGKTVKYDPFRRTLSIEYVKHRVVRVAVMDHQSLAGAFGQVDVPG